MVFKRYTSSSAGLIHCRGTVEVIGVWCIPDTELMLIRSEAGRAPCLGTLGLLVVKMPGIDNVWVFWNAMRPTLVLELTEDKHKRSMTLGTKDRQ